MSSSFPRLARLLENAARDIAFGVRVLRRGAGTTAVAVAILAVGIGANTTIFRFVSALLLQPPPVDVVHHRGQAALAPRHPSLHADGRRVAACLLVGLAGLTTVTGARTPVVWFKICPVLLSVSAVLLLAASTV